MDHVSILVHSSIIVPQGSVRCPLLFQSKRMLTVCSHVLEA